MTITAVEWLIHELYEIKYTGVALNSLWSTVSNERLEFTAMSIYWTTWAGLSCYLLPVFLTSNITGRLDALTLSCITTNAALAFRASPD